MIGMAYDLAVPTVSPVVCLVVLWCISSLFIGLSVGQCVRPFDIDTDIRWFGDVEGKLSVELWSEP